MVDNTYLHYRHIYSTHALRCRVGAFFSIWRWVPFGGGSIHRGRGVHLSGGMVALSPHSVYCDGALALSAVGPSIQGGGSICPAGW